MAEVADAELGILRNAYNVLAQMGGDPKAKTHLERALKAVKPEIETEEDVAARLAQPHVEKIDGLAAQMTEFLEAQKKRDEDNAAAQRTADVEAAFQRLEKAGYQEDGIAKIKQLMVDRAIADPEAAAALFDKQNPPQTNEQPAWTPTNWEIGSTTAPSADLKELFANEDAWADREAAKALNEIRLGQAA